MTTSFYIMFNITKNMDPDIIYHFHHIHHNTIENEENNLEHEVHHCGGDHVKINPRLNYTIQHCKCKKHRINKKKALGHDMNNEVIFVFSEPCPEGGYHVESGVVLEKKIK